MSKTSSPLPTVITVSGEVPAESLGVTMLHEHLIHRLSIHSGKADNTCLDVDLMAEELGAFRDAGGGTICDATPIDVGRDPSALRQVAEKSGVQVVSGAGLYQLEVWPDEMLTWSRSQLADHLVCQARGEDAGISAGFLGEIASHNEPHDDWEKYQLLDAERTLFAALADAQRRTGLAIYTHACLGRGGVAQLRVLSEAEARMSQVVIGHCDGQFHEDVEQDMSYYRILLEQGAWLGFDMFGWEQMAPDAERFRRIAALVGEGFADRIVISTDTCRLSQLRCHGGRGFGYLFTNVLPGLRQAGLSESDIHQMTVTNPATVLAKQST